MPRIWICLMYPLDESVEKSLKIDKKISSAMERRALPPREPFFPFSLSLSLPYDEHGISRNTFVSKTLRELSWSPPPHPPLVPYGYIREGNNGCGLTTCNMCCAVRNKLSKGYGDPDQTDIKYNLLYLPMALIFALHPFHTFGSFGLFFFSF